VLFAYRDCTELLLHVDKTTTHAKNQVQAQRDGDPKNITTGSIRRRVHPPYDIILCL